MERGLTQYVAIVAMVVIGGLSGTASGNDAYRQTGADTPASHQAYQYLAWNGWQRFVPETKSEQTGEPASAAKRSKAREAQAARQQRSFGVGYEYRQVNQAMDEADTAERSSRYRDARPDTGKERH